MWARRDHMIDPTIRVKAIVAYVFEKFLESVPDDFEEGCCLRLPYPPNADKGSLVRTRDIP